MKPVEVHPHHQRLFRRELVIETSVKEALTVMACVVEMAEIELARDIRPPLELAVGLVDVKNTWVEPPELVAERLRLTLKHIEPERVSVTPDCGFSQTARFVACRKLKNLADGVRLVRRELKG